MASKCVRSLRFLLVQLCVERLFVGHRGAELGEAVNNIQALVIQSVGWCSVRSLAHDVGFLGADREAKVITSR